MYGIFLQLNLSDTSKFLVSVWIHSFHEVLSSFNPMRLDEFHTLVQRSSLQSPNCPLGTGQAEHRVVLLIVVNDQPNEAVVAVIAQQSGRLVGVGDVRRRSLLPRGKVLDDCLVDRLSDLNVRFVENPGDGGVRLGSIESKSI